MAQGKIISIINFKGGVGKTTMAVNMAAYIARYNSQKKVLLIDLDPQSNASIWLLGEPNWRTLNRSNELKKTSRWLFFPDKNPKPPFIKPYSDPTGHNIPNLFLLAASFHMIRLEEELFSLRIKSFLDGQSRSLDDMQLLIRPFELFRKKFDYILIDLPPNLYNVSRNVIRHTDHILIPCEPANLSEVGLGILIHELNTTVNSQTVSADSNINPTVLGVAINQYKDFVDHNTGLAAINSKIDDLKDDPDCKIITQQTEVYDKYKIHHSVKHAEAVRQNIPLCLCTTATFTQAKSQVHSLTLRILSRLEKFHGQS